MDRTVGREIYHRIAARRKLFICAALLIVIAAFFLNMLVGLNAGPIAGLQALFDPDSVSRTVYNVMHYYRLPESMMGLLAGLALGMAGAEMQTILNNPLAEPYTLGISSAASFGAALTIAFGLGAEVLGGYSTVIAAFVCSMAVCLVISTVAGRRTSSPTTTILMGVAMLFLFQALVSLVQAISTKDAANSIMFWMFGSIGRNLDYANLAVMAVVISCCAVLFMMNAWKLTSLKLGDGKAESMGFNVRNLRRNTIIGISLVTAITVSFTGTIGFVGLVGPHISRILVGDDQRYFMLMSALCGAGMVLLASIVCKIASFAATLPIGVVTSLVGIPFFVLLIIRKRAVIG